MRLIECYMTQSTCYRGTTKGRPVGILWHDTGAGNPELRRYVQPDDDAPDRAELLKLLGRNACGNDWNHQTVRAGLNAWIGKLANGTVATVQTQPWTFRPWGCGGGSKGSCNGDPDVENSPFWIQFEICDDGYKDRAYFETVYREAVELTVMLCREFGIDPNGIVKYNGVTVPTILCHGDSGRLGLGSGHTDVLNWFGKFGRTMADVRRDVAAELSKPAAPKKPVEEVALEVLSGRWDNGVKRRELLEAAGYDYDEVQAAVKALRAQLEDTQVLDDVETPPEPTNERDRLLAILGDQWIETFADVPAWAKPEVRELIELGAINGTKAAGDIEETVIRGTVNGLIRPTIVALRAVKAHLETAAE